MKVVMLTAALLLLCLSPAQADWGRHDNLFEGVYLVTNAADLISTWDVTDQSSRRYEVNPILGKHPTPARLVGTFLATTVLHYGVMRLLPDDLRALAWNATINIKAAMFQHNYQVDDGYQDPKWMVTMQFRY